MITTIIAFAIISPTNSPRYVLSHLYSPLFVSPSFSLLLVLTSPYVCIRTGLYSVRLEHLGRQVSEARQYRFPWSWVDSPAATFRDGHTKGWIRWVLVYVHRSKSLSEADLGCACCSGTALRLPDPYRCHLVGTYQAGRRSGFDP